MRTCKCTCAHDARTTPTGVVHRDLKPENLCIDEAGYAKVCTCHAYTMHVHVRVHVLCVDDAGYAKVCLGGCQGNISWLYAQSAHAMHVPRAIRASRSPTHLPAYLPPTTTTTTPFFLLLTTRWSTWGMRVICLPYAPAWHLPPTSIYLPLTLPLTLPRWSTWGMRASFLRAAAPTPCWVRPSTSTQVP